jgi:hypothetical protein
MRIDYLSELNEEQRRAVEHGVERIGEGWHVVANHCWCRWALRSLQSGRRKLTCSHRRV